MTGDGRRAAVPAQKCGVGLSQWRNAAVEWAPDRLHGFIDGAERFGVAGGANADRDCIQCAPPTHQTIQLDNFHGNDPQRPVYEVGWARPGYTTLPDNESER